MPFDAGLAALVGGAIFVVGGISIWASYGGGNVSEGGSEQVSVYNEGVDVIEDDRREASNEDEWGPSTEFAGIDVIDGKGKGDSTGEGKEQKTQNGEIELDSDKASEKQTCPSDLADVDVIEGKERNGSKGEGVLPIEFVGIDVIDGRGHETVYNPGKGQNPKNTERERGSGKAGREQTTAFKLASGGVITGSVAVTESARRAGIDRHVEAGLAEELHAKAYARKAGGSVLKDNTSVFTPDGGVDKLVKTPDGERAIQSKHYGSEVGEAVLRQYGGDVDVFAATKGVGESVDPSNYDLEVITADDWLIRERAVLEGRRIKRGVQRGLQHSIRGVAGVARRVGRKGKYALKQLLGGAKLARRSLSSAVTRGMKRFARQPRSTQGAAVVVVGGALWLLWRKRTGKYSKQDLKKWLAVVGGIAAVFLVKRWWKKRR